MNQTETLLSLWAEARSRLSDQFTRMKDEDMLRRLHSQSNSLGFLLKHIGEVEQLFARNVFNQPIKASVETLGVGKDKGQYTRLQELLEYLEQSRAYLQEAISSVDPGAWHEEIETREFGRKTKAEALGRITSHTAYHAGQIGLILKYGQIFTS